MTVFDATAAEVIRRGDEARKAKRYAEAIDAYLEAARGQEIPDADLSLKLSRCHHRLGQWEPACQCLADVVDAGAEFTCWQAAANLLEKILPHHQPAFKRTARVAILGSYTTTQFVQMLRFAAFRLRIGLELYECDYAQYRQEILDPGSAMHRFKPDFVILAVHHGQLHLPPTSRTPEEDIESELAGWTNLWDAIASRSRARVIMHNFALPLEAPLGHLGSRLPGSRYAMMQRLNARLGEAAGNRVSIVDCERLAGLIGRRRWFDDKYWHVAKQAVSLEALPLLAHHSAAVLAGDLGLSRKCLVLDLDNTLWGGVIGEDGLSGIRLGEGADGEAYLAFQEYVLELKGKGIILAVCSKNNEHDAREPFEKHPDMRLKLDDFATFIANWQTKSENLATIAKTLNIGLDAIVFADDNPAEREIIRQMLPDVEVIRLPQDPSGYVRALAESVWFETGSFTEEDAHKTEQYRAKAEIARLQAHSSSLEDFHRSLDMNAEIAPFDELHLPRIVQLIGKTNQFNLTTRRHTMQQVQQFMEDPSCVTFYLKLRDRFTDHGLVSLLVAVKDEAVLDIDTWLMSCRVIGRTVEDAMLARLCAEAERLGCTTLRGTYIPTDKNAMVKDIFERFGFAPADVPGGREERATCWLYDLAEQGPIAGGCISTEVPVEEGAHGAA